MNKNMRGSRDIPNMVMRSDIFYPKQTQYWFQNEIRCDKMKQTRLSIFLLYMQRFWQKYCKSLDIFFYVF